ncbi:hypothetical protein [Nocardioides zeae]|uniref:AtuA-like ferredoxin-fold domain-containing protein n=1 Tax=Nocardioides zeae TaxID=1457234 RepID=A0A6P0HU82_9ACTN|nr:hypothetical protein [Nocardioides zeae]MDQ1105398.1 hypothetical protein [Nocardioides zeae]NEN80445.1 hypothetical protein [Nocardioides zeae]
MSTTTVPLGRVASARSGDKGADANIGLWTDDERVFEVLREQVTPARVEAHFRALCRGGVERHELPNLKALNFLLHDALDGGGAASLRTDAQGKTLSLGLLQMTVEVPTELLG